MGVCANKQGWCRAQSAYSLQGGKGDFGLQGSPSELFLFFCTMKVFGVSPSIVFSLNSQNQDSFKCFHLVVNKSANT